MSEPMNNLPLMIRSDGPAVVSTNYWSLPVSQKGYFYLSCNAGAVRLLVPRLHEHAVSEMATARMVLVTRGVMDGERDAVEIMFDDETDSPFTLHLSAIQCPQGWSPSNEGHPVPFFAYVGRGEVPTVVPGVPSTCILRHTNSEFPYMKPFQK